MRTLILDLQHSLAQEPERRHVHLSCEMLYIRRGKARFTLRNLDYTAGPGSLLFLSALEDCRIRVLSAPCERYSALLSLSELQKCFPDLNLNPLFRLRPQSFCPCMDLRPYQKQADTIWDTLHREYWNGLPYARPMAEALLKQLLVLSMRANPQNFRSASNPLPRHICAAQQYMEQQFTQELSVSDIATQLSLSESYLTHSFSDATGFSPKQYLLLLRLSYARELLEATDFSIAEIALRCGFSDDNHFIRTFRQRYCLPPGKWRKAPDKTSK